MATTLRLDALVRQSQASEAGRSPDQQLDAITRWADGNGATIVAEHLGRGRSGKSVDRLDVNAALERVRAGETDGVAVAFLNRLSRAPVEDALRVIREINEAGGKVVSVDHGGELKDDPLGEQMVTMDLANARRQWRETAARYAQTRREAVAEGKQIGKPPFGYRYADPTPKHKQAGVVDSRLVVDENVAPIVRELFERKASGATWLELAGWLDEVAPKPARKLWARQTVAWMIGNRTYLGEIRHGENVKANAHAAIVTPALWRRGQNGGGRRTPRGTYLLSGLARCDGCGCTLRGSSLGRNGRRIYKCANRACTARPTIAAGRLDDEVVEQFFTHVGDVRMAMVDETEVDTARDAVTDLTAKVEAVAAVVPSHPSAVAAHQEALTTAEGELAEAEDHLDALVTAAAAAGPDVRGLREDWSRMDLADKREHLRAEIETVSVSRAPSPTAKVPARDRVRVDFRR